MGVLATITHDTFPRQSEHVGEKVSVCFHYDLKHIVEGVMIRDDREDPWVGIILLSDGRYVLATECQYSFQL